VHAACGGGTVPATFPVCSQEMSIPNLDPNNFFCKCKSRKQGKS